jgi:hypothetical protein
MAIPHVKRGQRIKADTINDIIDASKPQTVSSSSLTVFQDDQGVAIEYYPDDLYPQYVVMDMLLDRSGTQYGRCELIRTSSGLYPWAGTIRSGAASSDKCLFEIAAPSCCQLQSGTKQYSGSGNVISFPQTDNSGYTRDNFIYPWMPSGKPGEMIKFWGSGASGDSGWGPLSGTKNDVMYYCSGSGWTSLPKPSDDTKNYALTSISGVLGWTELLSGTCS